VKNQGQPMFTKSNYKRKTFSLIRYLYISLALMSLFWGCAVKPNTVMIKDTSTAVEPDTIISGQTGETVTFGELMADLNRSQIIFIGETHTNRSHHAIQLKIIQAVFHNHQSMAVGMEMFDRSYQQVLDLWSAGQEAFLRKVHWYANWRFDFSLYKDILQFIKENRIKLVALNLPFYISARIRVGGIDNLADADKRYLPADIDTSDADHRDYVEEVFKRHHFSGRVKFDDFYMAQSIWDEIMAESIALNLNQEKIVVLAGNGHIQYKYGIPNRAYRRTGAAFKTIYLASVGEEVELGVADYIWVTPK
jgi:uncharacterized iron-regulated protein